MLGKKTKGEPVILTMVEKQGLDSFKSLITDNDAEFSTLSLVEQEIPNIKGFFTHAFAVWEIGTNKRHNGLLKEFIPKGKSLKYLKYSDLQKYTDAINHRPRRLLDYQTPENKRH